MNRPCRLVSLGALLFATAVPGCGREKADALAEVEKIHGACQAQERQKAYDIMVAAANKNETFDKSFRDVTSNVPDKSVIDVCGSVMDRVKRHIEAQ
jgi:hypothetical protein